MSDISSPESATASLTAVSAWAASGMSAERVTWEKPTPLTATLHRFSHIRFLPQQLSLAALGGGEGWGEVGDSRAVADTHLTLPRLRRGPLPLPPEGRRGQKSVSARRVQPLRDGDAEDAGEKAQELGAEPGVKPPGLACADAQEPDRRAAAKGEAQQRLRADQPGGAAEQHHFAGC